MAGQFTDGMAKTNVISEVYPITSSTSPTYASGTGAFGANAVNMGANVFVGVQLAQFVTLITNCWFQLPIITGGTLWQGFDSVGGSAQITLAINSSGTISFLRGATILGTSPVLFRPNVPVHLEIKLTVDSSAGLAEVRANGNPTAVISFSGNTRSTSNTWVDQIRLGPAPNTSGGAIVASHFMIYDTGGAAPNGYIGMQRIYTSVPTADSATSGLNQFSTSPSQTTGNHFKNVNEEPPDDDTSYNFDTTVGHRESYRVTPLPASVVTVLAVNAYGRSRIDAGGSHSENIVARNGTTDTTGAAQFQGPSYLYYNQFFPLDPNTGSAWTPSGFGNSGSTSNAEFGIEIAS